MRKIEMEALERINKASISILARKDVERLAKENAGLKLLVSGKDSEIEKARGETEKERKAGRKPSRQEAVGEDGIGCTFGFRAETSRGDKALA